MDKLQHAIHQLTKAKKCWRQPELTADIYEALGYEVIRARRPGGGIAWRYKHGRHWCVMRDYADSTEEALLLLPPGYWVNLRITRNVSGPTFSHCSLDADADSLDRDLGDDEPTEIEANNCPTPAIAICLAALKLRADLIRNGQQVHTP